MVKPSCAVTKLTEAVGPRPPFQRRPALLPHLSRQAHVHDERWGQATSWGSLVLCNMPTQVHHGHCCASACPMPLHLASPVTHQSCSPGAAT